MIIKSKGRKDRRFRQIVMYIASDKGRNDEQDIRYALFHNLSSLDLDGVIEEFRQNSTYLKKRKGANVFFHEWLSFKPEDAKNLTPEKVDDMVQEYVKRRAPEALAYGQLHWHDGHPHIHLVFSANNYKSSQRISMSKRDFLKLQKDMECFQLENYPELESICYLSKKEINKSIQDRDRDARKDKEIQMRRRTVKTLTKDKISALVRQCLAQARNVETFCELLRKNKLELYRYRGRLAGVKLEGKKYRFTRSLGIEKEELLALQKSRFLARKKRNKNINRSK